MNYINKDGMLIIKTESGDTLYFSDWLKGEHGVDEVDMRVQLIYDFDGDEDMVDERMEELESQFYDYCEVNDLEAEIA